MERSQVKEIYKWNTKELFENDEKWEELYKNLEKEIDFSSFKGKLKDKKEILKCFNYQQEVSLKLERLFLYAHMKRDEDTRNSKYNTLYSKAVNLLVKVDSESCFIVPELTKLDDLFIEELVKDKNFKDYDYSLLKILKDKKYILSEKEENILALGGEIYSSCKDIFTMIDNADLNLPIIKDVAGEDVQLSHGLYSVILSSSNRDLREKTFKEYYNSYKKLLNTITATYYGNVKKDVFLSKVRGYNSCLEKALSNEDVDISVYENLIKYVNKFLPIMHRYIKDRKEILNLQEMHMYDIYAPIVDGADLKMPYEDAYKLVKEGLKPLGEDYIALLEKGYKEGWIDVEETLGKRSGAYSTGMYSVHPYVLLNYQQTTHDIFTIAHEMGHALHSYLANAAQPYTKADYTIFVAEIASTVNEVLLLKYILNKEKDLNLKKYLTSYFIDMIRTTLFRQTMFAEFEYVVHDMVENGNPLTKENMNEVYLNLNKKYYGDGIVSDDEISYEWARIPHFYSSFYVYKYATGIISAINIANRILKEGESAVKEYKNFLKAGGSADPVNILKIAGVDLTTIKPYENAMQVFEEAVEDLEKLMK